MDDTINLYGDKLSPSGTYGSNISAQRIDELDQACIDFVKSKTTQNGSCLIVDVGGGSGAHSKRLAELGVPVFMIDLTDQIQNIRAFNTAIGREAVVFVQRDVREMTPNDWPPCIDGVYSQRMLGCIPYLDMLQLIQTLRARSTPKAPFFLSTGGLDTEYGQDYPDRNKPVEERFACFSSDMATKHAIFSPECLYRENELCELARKAGLHIVRSWTSPFGNPKVIAQSPAA